MVKHIRKLKSKKKALFLFGTGLFSLLLNTVTVFAGGKNLTDIYKVGTYHISTFSSYIVDSDFSLTSVIFGDTGVSFFKMLSNTGFYVDKLIWEVFDSMIDKLNKGAEMDRLIHIFFTFSQNIYSKLYGAFGIGLIGAYIVYLLYLKMFKSPRRASSALFKFILVVGFSIAWFGNGNVASQGEKFTKQVDSWSTSVEGLIFQATNGVEGLEVATNSDEAIKQIRNMYYQKAVVDPYLLLNYGTANLQELDNAGIDPTEFLGKDSSEKTSKNINKRLDDVKDNDENEKYRQYIKPSQSLYKAVIGLVTPLLNLSIGTPIMLIGVVRFVFQLGAILMLVAIPFLLILSFIPSMEYLIFKGFRSFLGFMFQKSIYSVLILVAFLVFNVVDTLVPMSTIVTFIVNIIVKGGLGLLAFAKRKEILQKLGLGHADATLSQVKNGANQVKKETTERVKSGVDRTQNLALKGANVAGYMNRGVASAVSAFQALSRSMQQQKGNAGQTTNGRVINPIEIGQRSQQKIPYSGNNVVYGEHDPKNPMNATNVKKNTMDNKESGMRGEMSAPKVLPSIKPFNNQNRTLPNVNKENGRKSLPALHLTKNPIPNFAGQKIPLVRTMPQVTLNASNKVSKSNVKKLTGENIRVTRMPVNRTGQKIPLTNPYTPNLVLNKQTNVQAKQVQHVSNIQRKEVLPIQESKITNQKVRSLPNGRTPQRKGILAYEK